MKIEINGKEVFNEFLPENAKLYVRKNKASIVKKKRIKDSLAILLALLVLLNIYTICISLFNRAKATPRQAIATDYQVLSVVDNKAYLASNFSVVTLNAQAKQVVAFCKKENCFVNLSINNGVIIGTAKPNIKGVYLTKF